MKRWMLAALLFGCLPEDTRPPLAASGLKLHDRLTAIGGSIGRAASKGGSRPS